MENKLTLNREFLLNWLIESTKPELLGDELNELDHMTVDELFELAEARSKKLREIGEARKREADALELYARSRKAGIRGVVK